MASTAVCSFGFLSTLRAKAVRSTVSRCRRRTKARIFAEPVQGEMHPAIDRDDELIGSGLAVGER
jgi:hypothetical protein